MKMPRYAGVATIAASLVLSATAALAQSWPQRQVNFTVPFGAGSGVDTLTRHLANEFQEKLGKPFVVDNKAGANGNVAAAAIAKTAPDGYNLLMVTPGISIQNKYAYKTMPFDFERDFQPVVLVSKAPMLILVNPKLPINTMADLVAYAKANPGRINSTSTGVGSQAHITLEALKLRAGVDMTHLPYNNPSQQNLDVISGEAQMGINYVTTTLGFVRAGQMRPLAITSVKRMAELPDIPTLEESGFPGVEAVGSFSIYVPKGTPAEVVEKLNGLVNAWLPTEKGKKAMSDLGMQANGGTPEDALAWVKAEDARWGPIMKAVVTPQ